MELQAQFDAARQRGLGLAAISYDSRDTLAEFSTRRGITFPLLSDPKSAVIKRYGLLNASIGAGSSQYGIPHPGTFVLDATGRVTARYFEEPYQERATLASILVKLGDAGQTATTASTAHLDMRAGISALTVAPGHRISLTVDVRPHRGIHVYAPGNRDYPAIALRVDPKPHVTFHALQYPPSQDFFFQPLNEHWKVYTQPFRLVQDLTIDASAAAQTALRDVTSLTLTATLAYQACDDKVCYAPGSVPISWTVGVRPLDRQRSPK